MIKFVSTAFTLPGNIPVYTFTLLISLALGVGFARALWHLPAGEVFPVMAAGIWSLSLGLITARAGYVAVHWPYFSTYPGEMIQLPLGGLTWAGMALGSGFALVVVGLVQREAGLRSADALVIPGGLLAAAGWLGCWISGCAYGAAVPTWFLLPARDEWGLLAPRVPVQLLGALLMVALTALLEMGSWRWLAHPGARIAGFYFGLGGIMAGLSLLRAYAAPAWNGLRLETWASLLLIALAGLCMCGLILFHRMRRDPNRTPLDSSKKRFA